MSSRSNVPERLSSRTPPGVAAVADPGELLERYRTLIERSDAPSLVLGADGRVTAVNDAFARLLPAREEPLEDALLSELLALKPAESAREAIDAALSGEPGNCELALKDAGAGSRILRGALTPLLDAAGVAGVLGVWQDVTDELHSVKVMAGQRRVLERLAAGAPLPDVLEAIVRQAESALEGLRGALMVVEGDTLRLAAAPSMSPPLRAALATLPIGPGGGACGLTAAAGVRVCVHDIHTDERTTGQRELARSEGIGACWSTPVLSSSGEVLAVLSLYHHMAGHPSLHDTTHIDAYAHLARMALERHLATEESARASRLLRESEATGLRDVSARRQAERAAAEAERQFRDVVEHSLTGICIVQHRRFAYVNPRFAEIFGRTPDELLALDTILEVVAPESQQRVREQMARRERRETTRLHYEFTGVRPDGTRVEVEWYGTESAYNGAPATIGTMLDITERSQAERALRQSEARFRIVAAVGQSMIFENDPIEGTAYRSEALYSTFGYPLEEVEPTIEWWRERVHPDDLPAFDATTSDPGVGPSGWAIEYRLRRKDGSYATVYERAALLRDETGKVYRVIGGVTDVSERRELQQQLVQSQKMEAVGQLAGGIAHDFNNLLTVVKCHTELLLDELGAGNPMREDVTQIHQASIRAAALTRQLLAFSRKQLLLPKLVDLNDVITGLEPMLRRLLGADITINTDLAPSLGTTMADAGQIEQVLVNFAVNARDAMPNGGVLGIRSFPVTLDQEFCRRNSGARPGHYCAVEVRDSGAGMDERTRARVFEPFFTTKEVGKGTGLGLSTVYGIIKQSDGYVAVESAPGQGSAFTIYLQRRDDQATSISGPQSAPALPVGSETVLLVEDERSVRSLARRMLERQGYTVLEAVDGEDALAVLRAHGAAVDLVITDLVMPRLSGRELAERLRADGATERFLFMSGYTDDDIVRHGLARPGMAFLPKPFTMGDLLRAVRRLLDDPRGG